MIVKGTQFTLSDESFKFSLIIIIIIIIIIMKQTPIIVIIIRV
jgi:hypothetical protein